MYGPYQSELIIHLCYVGGEIKDEIKSDGTHMLGSPVGYWRTLGAGRSVAEHEEEMFGKIRESMPLDELVWNWEATPVSFDIQFKEKCIEPRDSVEFNLVDVYDRLGRPCSHESIRNINRLVVYVDDNDQGTLAPVHRTLDGGWAFWHYDCAQKFHYNTPRVDDFIEVEFEVYNSCGILKTTVKSLSQTESRDKICEKRIRNKLTIPNYCNIHLWKDRVHINDIISIKLFSFDSELSYIEPYNKSGIQPYDRLFVEADYGEILDGIKTGGMTAFEIGDLEEIEFRYRAPSECKNREETITVYTSCGTRDEPATVPGDKIQSESLEIYCQYKWSGTMTIEKLDRFDCEVSKSNDGFTKSDLYREHHIQSATISIQAENIDDSPPGFNIEMGENLKVNGFMKCEFDYAEEHNFEDYDNPRTSFWKETQSGEDLINLNSDNLNLNFMASMKGLEEDGSLAELAELFESGDIDMSNMEDFNKKLESFGEKFEEAMGTGEAGESKVTVMVQLFGDCESEVTINQSGWEIEDGEHTSSNDSKTLNMVIGGAFAFKFEADYIRNDDGSATITGSYSNTTPINGGVQAGCPPRTETTTCTLNLSKRPKNKK